MDPIQLPADASLVRLKKLDSLPTLQTQLEEANALCNHSARADMILKWLLEKFKTNNNFKFESTAWQLLCSVARLMTSEKLATQLAASDILRIIQITLVVSGTDIPGSLVNHVAQFCQCLLQIANSTHGTPIQALLICEADKAAQFLGVWLTTIHTLFWKLNTAHDSQLSLQLLLEPSFMVWEKRKRLPNDNELFSRDCLVPAILLLRDVSVSTHQSSHNKRKRCDSGTGTRTTAMCVHTLESMLARHIFLPARLSFYASQKSRRGTDEIQDGASELDDLLKPLTLDHDGLSVVPMLVDVALRCIPATTLRQRQRETGWIETLITSLLRTEPQSRISKRNSTVANLLSAVESRRFMVSAGLLTKFAESLLQDNPSLDENGDAWQLIAQITKLNPNVFVSSANTKALLLNITKALLNTKAHDTLRMRVDTVVVPVMKAFAAHRNLGEFFDLWLTQSAEGSDMQQLSAIFAGLKEPLGDLIELSVSPDQVRLSLEIHLGAITSFSALPSCTKDRAALQQVSESFVLLDGIVAGLRASETLETILDDLEQILRHLIKTFNVNGFSKSDIVATASIWSLATNLIDIWYPRWAMRQEGADRVHEGLLNLFSTKDLLNSSMLKSAQEVATRDVAAGINHDRLHSAIQSSQGFIFAVCNIAVSQDDRDIREPFIKFLGECNYLTPALLRYRDTLFHVHSQMHQDVWSQWFSLNHPSTEKIAAGKALLETLTGTSTLKNEDFVQEVIAASSSKSTEVDAVANCFLESEFTSNSSPAFRNRVINTMLKQMSRHGRIDKTTYVSCLSILVKNLSVNYSGEDVQITSEDFWKIVDPKWEAENDKHKLLPPALHDTDAETVTILQIAVQKIMKQLICSTDRQDCRSVLGELLLMMKRYYTALVSDAAPNHLILIGAIHTMVETLVSADLPNFKPKPQTISTHIMTLLKMLEIESSESASGRVNLPVILRFLKTTTERVLIAAGFDIALFKTTLAERTQHLIEETDAGSSESSGSIRALCFQLACTWQLYADPFDLIDVGVRLLGANLAADVHEQTLQSFRAWIESNCSDFTLRAEIIKRLLLAATNSDRSAAFAMLRIAITTCRKEEAAQASDVNVKSIFPALLDNTHKVGLHHGLYECLVTVLKEKPFMVNQYSIESTVSQLHQLVQTEHLNNQAYLDACSILTVLLQQYRARLQDRMHIVVPLLQALLSCLFQKTQSLNPTARRKFKPTPRHAQRLSRIMQLLCNPPPVRKNARTLGLVDETRKAQAHVGRYMSFVLHRYCTEVLGRGLAEPIREAILPGIWAAIEAMEISDADGVKILSAAMNNSERAILRNVYDQYRTVHGGQGR